MTNQNATEFELGLVQEVAMQDDEDRTLKLKQEAASRDKQFAYEHQQALTDDAAWGTIRKIRPVFKLAGFGMQFIKYNGIVKFTKNYMDGARTFEVKVQLFSRGHFSNGPVEIKLVEDKLNGSRNTRHGCKNVGELIKRIDQHIAFAEQSAKATKAANELKVNKQEELKALLARLYPNTKYFEHSWDVPSSEKNWYVLEHNKWNSPLSVRLQAGDAQVNLTFNLPTLRLMQANLIISSPEGSLEVTIPKIVDLAKLLTAKTA